MQKNILFLAICMAGSSILVSTEFIVDLDNKNLDQNVLSAVTHLSQYDEWPNIKNDLIEIAKECVNGLEEDNQVDVEPNKPWHKNDEIYLKAIFDHRYFEHKVWQNILQDYYSIRRHVLCKAISSLH